MAESYVVSALVKKRSELAGEIEYYKKLLDKAKSDLVSVDKTIHIFDDSIDLRTIKSKRVVKKSYFASGRNDTFFTQKVRNLKSHDTLENLGYAIYYPKIDGEPSGRFEITEAGKEYLDENMDIVKIVRAWKNK